MPKANDSLAERGSIYGAGGYQSSRLVNGIIKARQAQKGKQRLEAAKNDRREIKVCALSGGV